MIRVLSGGAYSRVFEEIAPRDIDKLVLPYLYEGTLSIYDPRFPETQLTAHIMALIIRDTEVHDFWRGTLALPRITEVVDRLASQEQRLHEYFDAFSCCRLFSG